MSMRGTRALSEERAKARARRERRAAKRVKRLMFTFADIRFDGSDFTVVGVSNQRFETYDEAEGARNVGTMVVQIEV